MAKPKIVYSCQSCGYQSPKWMGKCPDCNQWNTFAEEKYERAVHPRGELSFIDNAVDTTTGRIKLKATVPNINNVLWPGQFVQTKLTLRTLTNATVVPARAIQSSQNGDFVFIVRPDSTVQKRPIVAGLTRGGKTVIESGVRFGDTVVTDGQLRLRDGSLIKAQEEKAAQLNGAKTP